MSFILIAAGDYNGAIDAIVFENEGVQCVNVPITMDMILENDEQFIAVVRSQDSAVRLAQSSALITIVDSSGRKLPDTTNSTMHVHAFVLHHMQLWWLASPS